MKGREQECRGSRKTKMPRESRDIFILQPLFCGNAIGCSRGARLYNEEFEFKLKRNPPRIWLQMLPELFR